MADNVAITAGTGTSIATDDAGAGGHCQIIKLAISADGSATLIPADGTNGLDVDVTRVQGTVTVDSELPAAGALADAAANPTAPAVGAHGLLWNGSTWDRARPPKLADFDTGAGTDNVPMYGIALPKSGGAVAGGTTTDPLQVNLSTRLSSDIDTVSTEGKIATYGAATSQAAGASATDVFSIGGSASKTIKVWFIQVTGFATAAGTQLLVFIKRSTANTGGTSSNVSRVPVDSTDAASASDVIFKAYSANATVGTQVGYIFAEKFSVPPLTTPAFSTKPLIWDARHGGHRPIVLRGTAEQLGIGCNGSILSGLELTVTALWTEE